MTQEEKDLLLNDLCSRIPYGVKFVIDNGQNNVRTLNGIGEDIPYEDWQMCAFARGISAVPIEDIKPYLFPMSSMTEEQNLEYLRTCWGGSAGAPTLKSFDWCDYAYSSTNVCMFLRYDGCQFLVNRKTIIKELYRRGL